MNVGACRLADICPPSSSAILVPSGVKIGDGSLSYALGPGTQGQAHTLLVLVWCAIGSWGDLRVPVDRSLNLSIDLGLSRARRFQTHHAPMGALGVCHDAAVNAA